MKEQISTSGSLSQRPWRALVCLLLAVTFLYNPFFVAVTSQVFPSVSHLPSYRANVASSELLKFKSDSEIAVQFVVGQNLAVLVLPVLTPLLAVSYAHSTDERVAQPVFHATNIWFRPPPIA